MHEIINVKLIPSTDPEIFHKGVEVKILVNVLYIYALMCLQTHKMKQIP